MTRATALAPARSQPALAEPVRTFLTWLSAACLATAALYFAAPDSLPAPWVASVVVLVVSVIPAVVRAGMGVRPGHDQRRWLTARAVTSEPARAAASPVVAGRRAVSSSTPEPRPAAPRPRVDARRYARTAEHEIQCPRCGGFAVESGARPACTTCQLRWTADPARPAAVVVRSWLHRREEPPCTPN